MAADARPHYVDVDHDHDPYYKHFFGELLLCFEVTHEGNTRQCCMVEYLWPDGRGPDGVPLETKYSRTKRTLYEVLDVRSVLYRASLVTPPPLRPVPGEQPYLVLNEDIYINW